MANPSDRPRTSGPAQRKSAVPVTPHAEQARPGPAQRVQHALAADPRFAGMSPRVTEQNGQICLDGWVSEPRARKLMGLVAERVVGANNHRNRIQNNLLVGPPRQRSDAEIQRAVDDFVMEERYLDPTAIHAEVTDGVVHLTGSINTSMFWRFVGALCWWIPGVRGVRNDLQVIHPEPDDDDLLAAAVQLMWDKDPLVDVTEVEVICHNGVASLSGTVGGQDAKDAAESDAWALEGVRDVVNQIEVVEIPGAPPIEGLGD